MRPAGDPSSSASSKSMGIRQWPTLLFGFLRWLAMAETLPADDPAAHSRSRQQSTFGWLRWLMSSETLPRKASSSPPASGVFASLFATEHLPQPKNDANSDRSRSMIRHVFEWEHLAETSDVKKDREKDCGIG